MAIKPLVSIVTPSFNQGRFLEETIKSVLNQDYPNLEYFVIDGQSTDNSLEIIKKYQDQITAWVSEPDQGQSEAINKGFNLSRGEIMAWINSDDLYLPGAVSMAVAFLEINPQTGMVYGDTELINIQGLKVGDFNAQQTNYDRLMRGGVYIPQPAAFWRKEVWDQVGQLNPDLHFAMDYDLWVRFAKISQISYTPQLWAQFRLHEGGKTTLTDDRCWPEMKQVYQREGGGLISVFMGKYILRRLLGPAWGWYKNLKFSVPGDGNE
jgi:glycosyltransferase involved in cell wall biosynthesis